MFVYPVCYQIRSDKSLVRTKECCSGSDSFSFDDYYQMYSSVDNFHSQINDGLIYAVRNSTFSLFFVFSQHGVLHLFNSRAEVTRFLRS